MNMLQVEGDNSRLNEFMEQVVGPEIKEPDQGKQSLLDFESIKPTPKHLIDENNPMEQGWYQWRLANWGTKWSIDPDGLVRNTSENQVCYSFDTAWGPPLEMIRYLSEIFPDLEFQITYFEQGNCFAGQLVLHQSENLELAQDYEDDAACQRLVDSVFGEGTWWVDEDDQMI
jgi:hypothetical protein